MENQRYQEYAAKRTMILTLWPRCLSILTLLTNSKREIAHHSSHLLAMYAVSPTLLILPVVAT
jgi:hypothetical protein